MERGRVGSGAQHSKREVGMASGSGATREQAAGCVEESVNFLGSNDKILALLYVFIDYEQGNDVYTIKESVTCICLRRILFYLLLQCSDE